MHLNATGGAAGPDAELSTEEREWQRAAAAHRTAELDYFNEQQHKPATVAFALYDNPLGAAAWIVEKFKAWSDSGDNIERAFTKDQLLTNVMIYLVTDTMATAVWFYRGASDDRAGRRAASSPSLWASRRFQERCPPSILLAASSSGASTWCTTPGCPGAVTSPAWNSRSCSSTT